MLTVCIIGKSPDKTIKTLLENDLSEVEEIIITDPDTAIVHPKIRIVDINSDNKAVIRNQLIDESSQDYILWLSSDNELEDTSIEEFIDDIEDNPDADIFYANEIIKIEDEEDIRNFSDYYETEDALIQALTLENEIPEWGVVTKKSIFDRLGRFNEEYEDYEFYEFLYKNLKNLRLKLAEFTFITFNLRETFIDTSFRSKALREALSIYDWKKEIFPSLSWDKNENLAYSTAYTMIGDKLFNYFDFYNASEYYRKAILSFHNQVSLKKLINTLVMMGFFDKAKSITSTEQGLTEQDVQEIIENIDNISKLVKELELAVEEGKAGDILVSSSDILSVYQGAPIYNILGVVYALKGEFHTAYKLLYKAVTMNPLDEDILYNLLDVANKIGKKEKVEKLVRRLLS
ncbi:glycosyltransferase [Persephonella sp.]|uniref:glycosyltransferase n=1 Tax=Persephonella sp. TaxID=2060922 RepID=UPI002615399C|nr:glycosyltransferase [Persephonella sp.]